MGGKSSLPTRSTPAVDSLHVNIRSFLTHQLDLEARIDGLPVRPVIVGVTKSWLPQGIEKVSLSG